MSDNNIHDDTSDALPTAYTGRCAHCPGRTPYRADPEAIARARTAFASVALDSGIREAVAILFANGVETFESCEGGPGHTFPEPTICFEGQTSEGLRVLSIALENGLSVANLRRAWGVTDGMIHGPWWELTLLPQRPPGPQLWWKELPRTQSEEPQMP